MRKLVRHLAADHTWKQQQFFNLEWMLAAEGYDDPTEVRCALSDCTRIGRYEWSSLRSEAMLSGYNTTNWFKLLSEEDRVLLHDL